jgi:hypothetical protein
MRKEIDLLSCAWCIPSQKRATLLFDMQLPVRKVIEERDEESLEQCDRYDSDTNSVDMNPQL